MAIQLIWSDKKRIVGLPISFTKYSLSEDRLFVETGLLKTTMEEILLYRIRDISYSQTLFQKILGVGTVIVHSSDKTSPTLAITNIKNAFDVKETIHEYVEKMKIERRMRVGEVVETHDCDDYDD